MRTHRLESLQKEVIDVKSRLLVKSWGTMKYDVNWRLIALKKLLSKNDDPEIPRHVIVAMIAALQTYFRGLVVTVTNFNDDYRQRAAEQITEKVSIKDALNWISDKEVTFGELIAHLISCNSVTDILSWLDALLPCSLREELTLVVSEYDTRNNVKNPKPIISDTKQLFADLSEAFRLRHILAHEAAAGLDIDNHKAKTLLTAVEQFTAGVSAVLWKTVFKDLPLTQTEMNIHAIEDGKTARNELATVLRAAKNLAIERSNLKWFRANHTAWKNFTLDWCRNTYGSLDGTMWPAIKNSEYAERTKNRIEQLTQWVKSQNI